MALPNWPAYSDDSGDAISGTLLNAAFFDSIEDALEALLYGEDNPTVSAVEAIDELVDARGGEVDLDARLDNMEADIAVPATGTINDTEEVGDIIDEVVDARGNQPVLDDRLSGVIDSDGVGVPASVTDAGVVTTGAQSFAGEKTFTTQPLARPGGASATTITLNGTLVADGTAYASTTSEADATSLTIPANTLNVNGKGIRIHAWGKTASGASTRTIKLYWDGSVIISFTTTVASGIYDLTADIIRTGVGTQVAIVSAGKLAAGLNTVTGVAIGRLHSVWDTAPMDADETAAIIVKTTIQDSAGANLTQLAFTAELIG